MAMRKVSFPFTVRHGGVKYTPGTPVEVEEKELEDMLAMGAVEIPVKAAEAPAEESVLREADMAEAVDKAAAEAAKMPTEDASETAEAPGKDAYTEPAGKQEKGEMPANLPGQENLFEQQEAPKPKRNRKK